MSPVLSDRSTRYARGWTSTPSALAAAFADFVRLLPLFGRPESFTAVRPSQARPPL